MKRTRLLMLAGSLVACGYAQAYPDRPVRLIVPFPPGGGTDITARIISPELRNRLGKPIVIDNRGGASTIIGTDLGAKSTPDGHTILIVTATFAVNPSLHATLPYDSIKDFAPITQLTSLPYIVVAHPSLGIATVKELIGLAKSKPGRLTYASTGNGSAAHLATEMFNASAGTQLVHVPYKGSAPALADLIGGHVSLYFGSMPALIPQVRAGKLRAIAVTGAKRVPSAPDVLTIAEAGVPGYDFTAWYGLLAPAGTAPRIVNRLYVESKRVLELSDVRERLMTDGSEPVGSTPAEFAALIRSEIAKYAKVVKQANIKTE